MGSKQKFKIVISDCHLSAGRFFEGRLNPHEDFHFDEEMCALFHHFSTGEYGGKGEEAADVELVIAGDYFDYLNVPVKGEFEDGITEDVALYKTRAIIDGHPKVMAALKKFASLPGKKITYLIGNHDAELFFPQVREMITRAWDPKGEYPSHSVEVIADRDRLMYEGGVEIRHGNQFEAGNELDFDQPLIETSAGSTLLNLPWGSIYVLKIINRMKYEREYLDKIRPIKVFIVVGLIFDPVFTLKFCFLSSFYFIKTRIFSETHGIFAGIKKTFQILGEESRIFFQDLERPARKILDDKAETRTIIFGHTHRPMDKVYADGKQYINTGTWTKMIDLDWRGIGQQFRRTFAYVKISDDHAQCELRQWVGEASPHKLFSS